MCPIRRVFEDLSLKQMLQLENPQDEAIEYALQIRSVDVSDFEEHRLGMSWQSIMVPSDVKSATDTRNLLRKYY